MSSGIPLVTATASLESMLGTSTLPAPPAATLSPVAPPAPPVPSAAALFPSVADPVNPVAPPGGIAIPPIPSTAPSDINCAICGLGDESVHNGILLCDGESESTALTATKCKHPVHATGTGGAFHQACCSPRVFIVPTRADWFCQSCDLTKPGVTVAKQLTTLTRKTKQALLDVKKWEDVVRTYTETKRSLQLLKMGKIPSESAAHMPSSIPPLPRITLTQSNRSQASC